AQQHHDGGSWVFGNPGTEAVLRIQCESESARSKISSHGLRAQPARQESVLRNHPERFYLRSYRSAISVASTLSGIPAGEPAWPYSGRLGEFQCANVETQPPVRERTNDHGVLPVFQSH